jgi:hypothetical protein
MSKVANGTALTMQQLFPDAEQAHANGYVMRLMSLRCIERSALGGDAIDLKFNGQTVWSSGKLRMHPNPANTKQVKKFDFANGESLKISSQRLRNAPALGLIMLNTIPEGSQFELWERRRLIGRRLLATSVVAPRDVDVGNITAVFAHDAARYALTYRITVRTPNDESVVTENSYIGR